jgi:UDP-glucuronate decarboxylase
VATTRSLTRRHGVVEGGRSGGLWSRQSLALLGAGILVGYVVLPVLLVEMDIEKAMQGLPKFEKPSIQANPYPIAESSNPYLRADQRTLETTIAKITTEAEKRLLEDRDVLSKQSLPTSTTPYVMKTAYLPDHQRKKILVTGGSGFVGSHLVDKLMMEGHEVIVVDNFFTGQKKNIAHWLHHPNFRCVSFKCSMMRLFLYNTLNDNHFFPPSTYYVHQFDCA